MRRIALADLRDSWISWLAVTLAFVAMNAALALSAIVVTSAYSSSTRARLDPLDVEFISFTGTSNMVLCGLVGLAVIGASTSLVVTSRRGAIARLALGGATPRQITRFLTTQVIIVSVVASIIGDVIAIVSAQPLLDVICRDRDLTLISASISLDAMLTANLACVGLCVLGGFRQARAAGKIPPVEALREATSGNVRRERPVRAALRGVRFVLYTGLVVAAFPGYRAAAPHLKDKALQTLAQLGIMIIPLTGLALTAILPWICGPLTRLWTSALPIPGPTWRLARLTVVAKSDRLVRSIIPIMFAVGLLFGLLCVGDTFVVAIARLGVDDLEGTSVTSMLVTIGLPLLIAIAGSIGNIVMMSRQRSAELALTGIVGATPRQQLIVPALEAVILTVTASILGLLMAAIGAAFVASGLGAQVPGATLSIPWGILVWTVLVCLAIVSLATVVPVLRSLRQPAPKVVARLVAA